MTIVLEQVCLLMLFAAAGYALCKTGKVEAKNTKLLSTLEVYVFLPATIFNTFTSNFTPQYLWEKYQLLIVSAVILLAVAAVAWPVAKWLGGEGYERNVYHYSLAMPNYGYMGYAMAGGIFGSEMLLNVMVYALPLSCYTYTVGYCLLTKSKVSVKRLFNSVTLSMLVGAIVGLTGVELPSVAADFLTKASACMAPVSMLLTGMTISEYRIGDLVRKKQVYIVAVLRLVVIPCAAAAVLQALSLQSLVLPALVVLAMPCGLNTVVFPKLIGESCQTGAALAFVTNVLCCATIPLCLFLFGGAG